MIGKDSPKMNVTYGTAALRRLASAAAAAGPEQRALHAQGVLLSLVDGASNMLDLTTTASARLVRLSKEPFACFRYANGDVALFLYAIKLTGEQMATSAARTDLGSVRAVQIAGIR